MVVFLDLTRFHLPDFWVILGMDAGLYQGCVCVSLVSLDGLKIKKKQPKSQKEKP